MILPEVGLDEEFRGNLNTKAQFQLGLLPGGSDQVEQNSCPS